MKEEGRGRGRGTLGQPPAPSLCLLLLLIFQTRKPGRGLNGSEKVNLKYPRRIQPAHGTERWCVSAGLSNDAGERRTMLYNMFSTHRNAAKLEGNQWVW